MMIRARAAAAGCLLCALVLVGCQSKNNANYPAVVSGKVTYNGGPVGGGTITFHGADGSPYPSYIGNDGSYRVDGIPEGAMTVTIETESINPSKAPVEYKGAKGGGAGAMYGGKGAGGGGMKSKAAAKSPAPEGANLGTSTYVKIPAKYKEKDKSGLSVTLTKGEQTHNFDLTD